MQEINLKENALNLRNFLSMNIYSVKPGLFFSLLFRVSLFKNHTTKTISGFINRQEAFVANNKMFVQTIDYIQTEMQ